METLQGVDALVIHMYAGAGLPAADSPAQTGDADDTDDVAGNNNRTGKRQANRSPNSPANKPEARPLAPASVAIALGQPFQRWQASRTDDFKHLPPEMDLWYTEYNLFDRAAPVHGTWMHGLFAATMSLLYLEESRVKLACLHALVGNAVFAAVFSNEKGFRLAGFTSPPDAPKTVPFALTAAGTSLSLLTETMRGQTTVQQISFSPAATIGVASGAYPALIGWSFTNERGARRAVLLNLSGQPHTVAIAAVAKRGGRCEQVSGDPLKLVTGPASLTRTEGAAQQKLVLPAYSVTRLY